jgi:DNA-binding GntR family transcriptional regulator
MFNWRSATFGLKHRIPRLIPRSRRRALGSGATVNSEDGVSGISAAKTKDAPNDQAARPAEPALRRDFDDWSPALQKARVYEQILLDIILGELAPGARLDEQALTRRYDAGLAGVRDALGRLALEGLVVRRARSGTTVAPLDIIEVRQAYEARALIEPHCAALAAAHATRDDVAALITAFDGADEAVRRRDSRALVAMDQRFHLAIARASQNATLARIILPLQHKMARVWVYSMNDDTEEETLDEIRRHRAVTDKIAAGDVEGARAAMAAMNGSPPAIPAASKRQLDAPARRGRRGAKAADAPTSPSGAVVGVTP